MSLRARGEIEVRALAPSDRPWLTETLEHWGGTTMVTRGRVHDLLALPGFVALLDGERVGLATYRLAGDEYEVTSLDSLRAGIGVGTALLAAVAGAARGSGCRRLWLITTNDNTRALRFYQRRDFRLAALHRDAVTEARRLKPTIPPLGDDGIPIRDEIELELVL
jgi:ribosomal protein S18 acetylase RimI-like enzyme